MSNSASRRMKIGDFLLRRLQEAGVLFVESIMDPYDALAPMMNSSNKGADPDYGPRGP
jgi:hypothetical protein